jgi:hypothetical protein
MGWPGPMTWRQYRAWQAYLDYKDRYEGRLKPLESGRLGVETLPLAASLAPGLELVPLSQSPVAKAAVDRTRSLAARAKAIANGN